MSNPIDNPEDFPEYFPTPIIIERSSGVTMPREPEDYGVMYNLFLIAIWSGIILILVSRLM